MKNDQKPTKAQIDYAMQRVDELAKQKNEALISKYMTGGEGCTVEQLMNAIKGGKVKALDPLKRIGQNDENSYCNGRYWPSIEKLFDLRTLCPRAELDHSKYDKAHAKLVAQVSRTRDQIMLGDMQTAIALITAFADMEF